MDTGTIVAALRSVNGASAGQSGEGFRPCVMAGRASTRVRVSPATHDFLRRSKQSRGEKPASATFTRLPGASAALLRMARIGRVALTATAPLCLGMRMRLAGQGT
jgi:hypothetical protein